MLSFFIMFFTDRHFKVQVSFTHLFSTTIPLYFTILDSNMGYIVNQLGGLMLLKVLNLYNTPKKKIFIKRYNTLGACNIFF